MFFVNFSERWIRKIFQWENVLFIFLFVNSKFNVKLKEKHQTIFLQQQTLYTICLLDNFLSFNLVFNLLYSERIIALFATIQDIKNIGLANLQVVSTFAGVTVHEDSTEPITAKSNVKPPTIQPDCIVGPILQKWGNPHVSEQFALQSAIVTP